MNSRAWTSKEEAALRDALAACTTWPDVCAMLPGRTPAALMARAALLGLHLRGSGPHRAWTSGEEAALAEALDGFARRTGRTRTAVAAKAMHLASGGR